MNEQDLEGSLVLERLAEVGRIDAFWEAVDADDFAAAEQLMKAAGIDAEMVEWVLEEMGAPPRCGPT